MSITSPKRNGTANPFMMFAPLEGQRHVNLNAEWQFTTNDARIRLKRYPSVWTARTIRTGS